MLNENEFNQSQRSSASLKACTHTSTPSSVIACKTFAGSPSPPLLMLGTSVIKGQMWWLWCDSSKQASFPTLFGVCCSRDEMWSKCDYCCLQNTNKLVSENIENLFFFCQL